MKNSLKKQINEVLDDRRSYLILKFWLFVLFVVLCLPSLLATISALGFN